MTDIAIQRLGHVHLVEIRRPPYNFLDLRLVQELAEILERLDKDDQCRAIVLATEGKAFCAGGNFAPAVKELGKQPPSDEADERAANAPNVHDEALRLFGTSKPIVAAVHGAAIGGGLSLALIADFRVTCAAAKFAANFTRLGLSPGLGLTVTLPELIGKNNAELLFYTGRRIGGEEAAKIGLANLLVEQDQVRDAAIRLANEIAECAPLAVGSTRLTMRAGLIDRLRAAAVCTMEDHAHLLATEDFKEGIKASIERRPPSFKNT